MRIITRFVIIALSLSPLFAQKNSIEAQVDRMLVPLVQDNLISGTILMAKGEQILFSKGYGLANREWDVANTVDTVFRLGSVTKQFTALGILILADRGKLSVHDTLDKYIRGFPNGERITIHSLLNHTSGVQNYNNIKDYDDKLIRDMSIDQVVQWFMSEPSLGQVGEKFAYSNSGYVLLAAVIEKVSGEKFADFLKKNIFTPLKMDRSGLDVFEIITRHRADGYACYDGEIINTPYRNLPFTSGAGSLYSTAEDLFKWSRAVLGNKLIRPELTEKMFTPGQGAYGYGWFIRERFGRKLIEHAGAINGFGAQVQLFPADDVAVISLYNFESAFQRKVDEALGAIALGLPVESFYHAQGCSIPDTAADNFLGTYSLDENVSMAIEKEGNRLFARLSDGRRFACLPQNPESLLIKELHFILQPYPKQAGPYETLLVSMGLNRFPLKRIQTGASPSEKR